MVVGAPVALLAYSRRARDFVKANKQGFYNLFIGTMACLLSLRNIKYQYDISALKKKLDEKDSEIQYLYDSVCSEQGTRWIMEQLSRSKNKEEDMRHLFQTLFKAAQTEAKLRHQTKVDSGTSTKNPQSSEEEDQLMEALGENKKQVASTTRETSDSEAPRKEGTSSDEKKTLNNYKGWL